MQSSVLAPDPLQALAYPLTYRLRRTVSKRPRSSPPLTQRSGVGVASLADRGANEEQVSAFAEAADRRYGNTLAEISMQAELSMLAEDGPGTAAR